MYINQETQADFQDLIVKTIEANMKLLEDTKRLPYDVRLQVISSVSYNIDNLHKSIG